MPSRRNALSLSGVAVLAFQLCMARLAAAQQTPTDAPLAAQPSPDAQAAATPGAHQRFAQAAPARRHGCDRGHAGAAGDSLAPGADQRT